MDPVLDGSDETEFLELDRSQVVDEAAQLAAAHIDHLLQLVEPRRHGCGIPHDLLAADLETERDAEQRLRDPVVHLARDPIALAGEQHVLGLLGQPGVLDSGRGERPEDRRGSPPGPR